MNIKHLFTSMTEDKDFRLKLLTGTFVTMLGFCAYNFLFYYLTGEFHKMQMYIIGTGQIPYSPFPLLNVGMLSLVVCLICASLLLGYFIQYLNGLINDRTVLPELKKPLKIFNTGIKMEAWLLLSCVPFYFVSFFLGNLAGLMNIYTLNDIYTTAYTIKIIIFLLLFLFVSVSYCFIAFIQSLVYAKDLKLVSFFDFKEGFSLIKNNTKGFIALFIILLVLINLIHLGFIYALSTWQYSYITAALFGAPVFYFSLILIQLCAKWVISAKNFSK